jgi:hypothetical protein
MCFASDSECLAEAVEIVSEELWTLATQLLLRLI